MSFKDLFKLINPGKKKVAREQKKISSEVEVEANISRIILAPKSDDKRRAGKDHGDDIIRLH